MAEHRNSLFTKQHLAGSADSMMNLNNNMDKVSGTRQIPPFVNQDNIMTNSYHHQFPAFLILTKDVSPEVKQSSVLSRQVFMSNCHGPWVLHTVAACVAACVQHDIMDLPWFYSFPHEHNS